MKKHPPFTIRLDEKARANLTALRAAITKAAASGNKQNSQQIATEKEINAIPDQIARLECKGNLTDEVTLAIAAKKEKLRLLKHRLEASEKPSSQAEAELNRLLMQFRVPYHEAMRQVGDQLTQQILQALAPYYCQARLSPALAADTDAMRQFGSSMSIQWGQGENPIRAAKKAVELIDQFLAGQSPFQLDMEP